jgi:hypothetical protein
MRPIPETENALVLRTDFSNEASWEDLRRAILEPVGDHSAHVTFVSDPEYDGISKADLLHLLEGTARSYLFVVDEKTLADSEFPIIALDLFEDHGRTFRVIPHEMWSVENNLSLGNMDFSEFADAVDDDGVFRGF